MDYAQVTTYGKFTIVWLGHNRRVFDSHLNNNGTFGCSLLLNRGFITSLYQLFIYYEQDYDS
jgi:hypothetical protein